MFNRNFKIPCDLFGRNATRFNHEVNSIGSDIWIEMDNRKCDAKSLLGLLSMRIEKGSVVNLVSYSEDYNNVFNKVEDILKAL